MSDDCGTIEPSKEEWQLLAEFSTARDTCHETGLVERVLEAVRGMDLPPTKLIQVREAVIASLGSPEKAPQSCSSLRQVFRVWVSSPFFRQSATTSPAGASYPNAARSSWGFFLTRRRLSTSTSGECCLIELFLYLEGASDDRPIT